jgi:hypothetical protein
MNDTRLLPLVLLATLASCVTAGFTQLEPYSSPPRPVSSVELYRNGMPNRPYRQVGLLRVRSSIGWDAAMQRLMEAGADYGCDAVAGVDSGESTSVGISPYGAFVSQHDYITASCLLWTEGGQPQQPQQPPPSSMPPPVRSDE